MTTTPPPSPVSEPSKPARKAAPMSIKVNVSTVILLEFDCKGTTKLLYLVHNQKKIDANKYTKIN